MSTLGVYDKLWYAFIGRIYGWFFPELRSVPPELLVRCVRLVIHRLRWWGSAYLVLTLLPLGAGVHLTRYLSPPADTVLWVGLLAFSTLCPGLALGIASRHIWIGKL